MPRAGMEPRRREALVRAAVSEIAAEGAGAVTVAGIARRAGMSPALAHHYFGSKDRMLAAAMRHVLTAFGAEARRRLAAARTPRGRLDAIVEACFAPSNFRPDAVAAWLAFYERARSDAATARLLHVYHMRLHANLVHALRPLAPDPEPLAETLGALIDGLYLRQALRREPPDAAAAVALVTRHVDEAIAAGR